MQREPRRDCSLRLEGVGSVLYVGAAEGDVAGVRDGGPAGWQGSGGGHGGVVPEGYALGRRRLGLEEE